MQKLSLEVKAGEDEKPLILPYRYIRIVEKLMTRKKRRVVIEFFLTNCKHIEKMTLNGENDLFIDFLPLMSNITELSLSNFAALKGDMDFKINLPNLESLILLNSSSFVDVLQSHKIETLKVSDYSDEGNWHDFFATCSDLKYLYLHNFVRDINLCDFGFTLSSLMMKGYDFLDESCDFRNKIYALIRANKDTLKKISLDLQNQSDDVDPFILKFIIEEMQVEELTWISFYSDHFCYSPSKDNNTLKKLKLDNFLDFTHLFDVLKTLRAVEDFDYSFNADGAIQDFFQLLQNYVPKLRTLTIRYCFGIIDERDVIIEECLFKALQVETLIIYFHPTIVNALPSDQPADGMIFATCAPNVKKLIIKDGPGRKYVNLSLEEFKIILKTLIKLEEFEFRGTLEIDDEILALISHSKLRRITIEYDSQQLAQVIETCEILEAASSQLVVIKVLGKLDYDYESNEIDDLFKPSCEF